MFRELTRMSPEIAKVALSTIANSEKSFGVDQQIFLERVKAETQIMRKKRKTNAD